MLDKKASLLIRIIVNKPNNSFIYYSKEANISYAYVVRLVYEFQNYNWVQISNKNKREKRINPTNKLLKIADLIFKLESVLNAK